MDGRVFGLGGGEGAVGGRSFFLFRWWWGIGEGTLCWRGKRGRSRDRRRASKKWGWGNSWGGEKGRRGKGFTESLLKSRAGVSAINLKL